ncbi:hypothetical protein [Desulfoluna spongiiphila]|uniref:hypothetical protein n=1 Tax=Desulfoluna spongiiphila TaxID=419481 RepID=UPI001257DE23|nr:hypothetical protein [Desulfoluna spongiiphila]VVS95029.1 hypothetical protein DBB_46060 [Desulfoluna spongiiphila]
MAPFRYAAFFSILLFLFSVPTTSATTVIPVSLTQLTQKVDTIVAGVVRETHAYWDEGRIYTDVTLETMEFLKHPTAHRPETIVVRTMGGQIGDMRMEVHGVPDLALDEEVVLFLRQHGEDYTIYGLYYGLCRIETNPDDASQSVTGPVFRARTTQSADTKALSLNPLPPNGEALDSFFQRVRDLLPPADETRQP